MGTLNDGLGSEVLPEANWAELGRSDVGFSDGGPDSVAVLVRRALPTPLVACEAACDAARLNN